MGVVTNECNDDYTLSERGRSNETTRMDGLQCAKMCLSGRTVIIWQTPTDERESGRDRSTNKQHIAVTFNTGLSYCRAINIDN